MGVLHCCSASGGYWVLAMAKILRPQIFFNQPTDPVFFHLGDWKQKIFLVRPYRHNYIENSLLSELFLFIITFFSLFVWSSCQFFYLFRRKRKRIWLIGHNYMFSIWKGRYQRGWERGLCMHIATLCANHEPLSLHLCFPRLGEVSYRWFVLHTAETETLAIHLSW